MTRIKKILLAAAVALVLGSAALYFFTRPLTGTVRARLLAEVSDAIGMPVSSGGAGLALASGLELSIKDLAAESGGEEALRVKELRIRIELLPLLWRKISVAAVTLVEPAVLVVKHPDGTFNFKNSRAPSGKRLLIPRLAVSRGSVVFTDEGSGRKLEAAGLELALSGVSYGGPESERPLKKMAFKGGIKCAALKAAGLTFTDLALGVTAGKGDFNFSPLTLKVFGAAGSGSLGADLASAEPAYRLVYASGQFRAEDLLVLLYHGAGAWKTLRGLAGFRAELTARGNSAAALRGSLAGSVLIDGQDLELKAGPAGKDLIKAESVSLALDPAPLVKGELRLKRLSVTRPEVSLVRRGSGAPPAVASKAARPEKPVMIEELDAAGGRVVYADEKGAVILGAEGVDFSVKDFVYGGRAGHRTAARLSFNGDVKCSTLTAAGVSFTGLAARTAAVKGVYVLDPLTLSAFRGAGRGRLRADLAAAQPAYKLDYALKQHRVGEFLQAFSREKNAAKILLGKTDLKVDISARGTDAAGLKRTLAGRLAMSGKDLTLTGMDTDEVITKYLRSQNFNLLDVGAFLLAGPLGPAVTKSYNFADAGLSRGRNGVIKILSSVWTVKDGAATAEDAAIATPKYRVALKGGLDLPNGKFKDLTLAVLDKKGCAVSSQNIQGTFSSPQLGKITMLESLAGPVLSVLGTVEKLVPGLECGVFYSGSVPQPAEK
jgi:AsmA protein